MNFLLDEDEALKNLLKGMTVTDQKAAASPETKRKVDVWFGQPDQEIRAQSYPYITIDMIDVAEDFARAHRGRVKPAYLEDPETIGEDTEFDPTIHDWNINYPIPINIDYQITTYARQPRHDRQILSQLLHVRIPLRFAVLSTGPNTRFGTTRRLDVLDISKRDITESGKRLFVNAITVRVSSEVSPEIYLSGIYNKMYKVSQSITTGPDNGGSQILGRNEFTSVEYTIPE